MHLISVVIQLKGFLSRIVDKPKTELDVTRGAIFNTRHRFLGENPFELIRTLKKYIKKTPSSMLLRGQNLVGYRNYADDVARLFVDKSCEVGMNVFRVFDALDDFINFQTVVDMSTQFINDRIR